MKNLLLAIYLILIITGMGCNQNKVKKEVKEIEKETVSSDSARKRIEWMKLNNEWVPLITELDRLLSSGKDSYKNNDLKGAAIKINNAETIIINKSKEKNAHKDLLSSSKALKELSKKIESGNTNEKEIDSVIYKVCDVHMKNCWILKDKETDLWVFEDELQIHLDSAYYYIVNNDSLKSQDELSKANWLIDADSKKYCDPKGEKISDKIRQEMHTIKHAFVKGEQATIGKIKIKSSIAKTYFFKADMHYTRASQISFNYDSDRLEGDNELAREIKASVFYLEKAFATQGITISEKETFQLENALLLGNELLSGYTHPKEDMIECIKDLGRLIIKYRNNFQPDSI